MKRGMFFILAAVVITALAMQACSSSEETESTTDQQNPEEYKTVDTRPDVIPTTDQPAKETEEIPNTERNTPPKEGQAGEQMQEKETPPQTGQQQKTGLMMWSVQIGAFKAESGALQLVNEAKKKFNQPVYKDYDPVSGFYKVNIGSFSKREEAGQFKTEVQSKGYPDAFTVEARR